ncbi:hypothetical protein [Arthrobacter psychrolactophilus]
MNAPTRHWHPFGRTKEEDHAILDNGGDTGWSDENGRPAPWPQDFLNPNAGWVIENNTQNATENAPF